MKPSQLTSLFLGAVISLAARASEARASLTRPPMSAVKSSTDLFPSIEGSLPIEELRHPLATKAMNLHQPRRSLSTRLAYVTLLYSDFIHGTRALGQSLRDTGTKADTVVLVTPDVSAETREQLSRDGWIVRPVVVEPNPNENFQARLVFVYTKLLIVEMEDLYDSVVFLDADTLVLENIDELFDCGPFCAVMRHSELLNSGVLVVTPDRELYDRMHLVIGELDSYTGGDQGFLNSFYPYFAACPAFEPYSIENSHLAGSGGGFDDSLTPWAKVGSSRERTSPSEGRVLGEWMKPQAGGCKRLPTRYNGDWPLLFIDGDVQVVQATETRPGAPSDWTRRKRMKLLHFTFGTAKPWHWWTYPFLPYVDEWITAYYRAERRERIRLKAEGKIRRGRKPKKRPGWSGVPWQLVSGFAPILVVAAVSRLLAFGAVARLRATKGWNIPQKALHRLALATAKHVVPLKAVDSGSVAGSIFSIAVGFATALSAAVLAFNAVPAESLGPSRPEAAWAFFWARSTALLVLLEGSFLFLITLKAQEAVLSGHDVVYSARSSSTATTPAHDAVTLTVAVPSNVQACGGYGSESQGSGRRGRRCPGGLCLSRHAVVLETLGHLLLLSALAVWTVSGPLRAGLNGSPASREIIPGVIRLLELLVLYTFSAVRLPALWAAYARTWGTRRGAHGMTR